MGLKKRAIAIGSNALLVCASIAIGYVISNTAFLLLIRSANQSKAFPRQILSQLPAPSRWGYPDLGTTGSSADIALIGDSYVEGSSDDYVNNIYDYSFAHYLYNNSRQPFANFGTSGSHLIKQIELYEASLNGEFWPLTDGRKDSSRPSKVLLFFYEGNDLDDYFNEKNSGGNAQQLKALKSLRRFQPLRLFLKSLLVNLNPGNPKPASKSDSSAKQETRSNNFCMPGYCRTNYQMQSASPNLSPKELDEASKATAAAVIRFAKKNPTKKTCLVYIPSPGTIYSPNTIRFEQARHGKLHRDGTIMRADNLRNSLQIRGQLQAQLKENNIPFVDATPQLTEAAKLNYLHGEGDQKHFNSSGNSTLAKIIQQNFTHCFPSSEGNNQD